MSDRFDWLFGQLVGESEMDAADAALETAERSFASDWDFTGIAFGLQAAFVAPSELYNRLSAGVAYDQVGRRIPFEPSVAFSLDLQRDGNTAIGDYTTPSVADGNDIRPGVNQERWVSVYIQSERLLSDERIDAAGASVFFSQEESFTFFIKAGPLYASGAAPATPDVALETDKILLNDSLYRNTVADGYHIPQINTSRRMSWLNLVDSVLYPFVQLTNVTPLEAATQLLSALNQHIGGSVFRHNAVAIDVAASAAWADTDGGGQAGTANAADNLQARVNKVITDLVSTAATRSGAHKLGAAAYVGAPLSLPVGTVGSQLEYLLDQLNLIVGGGAVTAATNVLYAGSPNWADGTSIPNYGAGAGVESAIDQIVSDLAGVAGTGGVAKIGSPAIAAPGTPGIVSLLGLAAEGLGPQLEDIVAAINSRVRRVGDTLEGNLLPDAAGARALGALGTPFGAMYSRILELLSGSATATPLKITALSSQRADLALLYGVGNPTSAAAAIAADGHYLSLGMEFRDDFVYSTLTAIDVVWTRTTNGAGNIALPTGANTVLGGLVRLTVTDANGDLARINTAAIFDTNSTRIYGIHARVRRVQLAGANRTFEFGFVRSIDANRYVIFRFTANGNWEAAIKNGAADPESTQAIAASANTNFNRFDILFHSTNVVEFLFNGVSYTIDHAGGVPQAAAGEAFVLRLQGITTAAGGGAANVDIDWIGVSSSP